MRNQVQKVLNLGLRERASGSAGQHESLQDSGEASQLSTTMEGGVEAHRSVPLPSMTPGESSGLQANTGRSGTGTEQVRRDGEAAPEGLVAEDFHEGFVTPRSQQTGLTHHSRNG